MLNIEQKKEGTSLSLELNGWMDAATAPILNEIIENGLDGVENLTINFANLEYLTSAGLRVLLTAQKVMLEKGEMVVTNANEDVMEVFELTGFTDILTIK